MLFCKNLTKFQNFITQFPFLLASYLPPSRLFPEVDDENSGAFDPKNFGDPGGEYAEFEDWMFHQLSKFNSDGEERSEKLLPSEESEEVLFRARVRPP